MVATLSAARLRQAFFLRASRNDPLTLKLITPSTEPPRPLSTCSQTHARDFTRTINQGGCICSNYGCIPILPVIHCGCKGRRTGGRYRTIRSEALGFERRGSTDHYIPGRYSLAHTLRHPEDPHVHADPQGAVLLRPPAPRRPVLHGHQPPVPPQALRRHARGVLEARQRRH